MANADIRHGVIVSTVGIGERPAASDVPLDTLFIDASNTWVSPARQPVYRNMQLDAAGTRAWANIGATLDQATLGLQMAFADSTGVPGPATQNVPSGKAAIAASASSVVITNNQAKTTTRILVTPIGALDTTARILRVSAQANGSFTVAADAAATAAVSFSYLLIQ